MSKALELDNKKIEDVNGDYSTKKKFIAAQGKGILDLAILIGAAISLGFGIRTVIYGVQNHILTANPNNIIFAVLLFVQAVGIYFTYSFILPLSCGLIGLIASIIFKLAPGPVIIVAVVYCLLVTVFAEVLWKKYKNNSICS